MRADVLKPVSLGGCAAGGTSRGTVGEKWLCALWRRQVWVGSLATAGGRKLHVVYPGRHTFDHGPDFRDALIVFDDDLVRGDVELHVRTGDWRNHGHQVDAHYNRVILHVVWHDDGLPALTTAGHPIPVLALEERTVAPINRTDFDEHVEDEVGPTMPCFLGKDRGLTDRALSVLVDMGQQRLVRKAAVLEAALSVDDPAQVLYAALLESMGYACNREPCRQLAQILPWRVVAAVACGLPLPTRIGELEALLLGAAGLLLTQRDVPRSLDPEDASYAARLAGYWSTQNALWQIEPLARKDWRFARVRPENFPPRRLAAAAHLFAPYVAVDLPSALLGILRSEDAQDVPAALETVLSVPASGYWATHHDFGGRPSPASHLLGRSRAADAAVNVVLPFAIAYSAYSADPALAGLAHSAYAQYPPLAENEFTRYVARLVFGRARPKGISAVVQQGLLHVYRQSCQEKRCGDCPLGALT